jgi:hypothetical protein
MAEDQKTTPRPSAPAKVTEKPADTVAADQPVVVTDAPSDPFATKPGDVPVDPRSGQPFTDGNTDGLKGTHGEDTVNATGNVVPGVNPDRIPAEVTPGVSPDAGGDALLAAAQAKAPNLTAEFVTKMKITNEMLAQIARGEVPPPPSIGPIYTTDLYLTPGGWQQTPPGVPPQDVGKNTIGRS